MGENIINLISSKLGIGLILSIILSLVAGPIAIPLLRKLKFGQNIREEGPESHLKKAGTPTMGGVIFILSSLIVMLILGYKFNDKAMIALYSLIAFGFIGFLFILILCQYKFFLAPVYKKGEVVEFIVNKGETFLTIYAATTNAVNLTDGLDGLATSVSILVLTFFTIVCFMMKETSLAVFCVVLIGGLIGFLKYNAYPAKIFMGDTGSLAIGGAIATIAIILEQPLLIIIVGGVYVFETLSVIIQVTSFKLTGKRVFKMAPVHHHFEKCGWSEVKIVTVFSLITAVLCLIGFLAL